MRVRNPKRVCVVGFSEWVNNEATKEGENIIKNQSQRARFYLFTELGVHPIGELLGAFLITFLAKVQKFFLPPL